MYFSEILGAGVGDPIVTWTTYCNQPVGLLWAHSDPICGLRNICRHSRCQAGEAAKHIILVCERREARTSQPGDSIEQQFLGLIEGTALLESPWGVQQAKIDLQGS